MSNNHVRHVDTSEWNSSIIFLDMRSITLCLLLKVICMMYPCQTICLSVSPTFYPFSAKCQVHKYYLNFRPFYPLPLWLTHNKHTRTRTRARTHTYFTPGTPLSAPFLFLFTPSSLSVSLFSFIFYSFLFLFLSLSLSLSYPLHLSLIITLMSIWGYFLWIPCFFCWQTEAISWLSLDAPYYVKNVFISFSNFSNWHSWMFCHIRSYFCTSM